jgi:glutamyl-tRNA synthetase
MDVTAPKENEQAMEAKGGSTATRSQAYRGRIAPSPTGFLHLGHARTFWIASERSVAAEGTLVFRNDDLDYSRGREEFTRAALEDLKWLGFRWEEGPDIGGSFGPYNQSERISHYKDAFERLKAAGAIYPCTCSRRDVLRVLQAPHAEEDEPIYPGTCRNGCADAASGFGARVNWRFRVPDCEEISFEDGGFGQMRYVAGKDFGDFVVWRHEGLPSYQLACVVDDALMHITEVVRGGDLLLSTARQILLYRALEWAIPAFYHCPLVTDASGARLAKRHDALSLRKLRESGKTPEEIQKGFEPLSPPDQKAQQNLTHQ